MPILIGLTTKHVEIIIINCTEKRLDPTTIFFKLYTMSPFTSASESLCPKRHLIQIWYLDINHSVGDKITKKKFC